MAVAMGFAMNFAKDIALDSEKGIVLDTDKGFAMSSAMDFAIVAAIGFGMDLSIGFARDFARQFELSSDKDSRRNPPISYNYDLFPGFWYTIDGVLPGMNIPEGWSMISLPVIPNDFSLSSLFPDAVVVYDYVRGQGYVRVENLEIGEGYWILLDQNQSYTPSGEYIQSYSKTVNEDGWEMIGGCSYPAQASTDSCQISVIYKFVQGFGYQRLTEPELMPGKGYWVLLENVVDQCELTVEVIDP